MWREGPERERGKGAESSSDQVGGSEEGHGLRNEVEEGLAWWSGRTEGVGVDMRGEEVGGGQETIRARFRSVDGISTGFAMDDDDDEDSRKSFVDSCSASLPSFVGPHRFAHSTPPPIVRKEIEGKHMGDKYAINPK